MPVRIIASFLLPPFCFIALAVIGLVVSYWRPRFGRALAGISLSLLWIVSTGAFNTPFLEAMSWPAVADVSETNGAQAIVVLSGGVYRDAPEYGGADTVNWRSLERTRYTARLARQTGLPVLASGGRTGGAGPAESDLIKSVMEDEFGIPVRWVEVQSRNTYESARESAQILRAAGVSKVYLVTHSAHMRRAVQAFGPTGVEVIPAPVSIYTPAPLTYRDFFPSAIGYQTTYHVAHELVGRVWYAIRERFDG